MCSSVARDSIDREELMNSAWVATQRLRTGYDVLVELLLAWVGRCVQFEDAADLEGLVRSWHMVGLSEQWAQLCVRLQIRWSEGKLDIQEHLEHDEAYPTRFALSFCACGASRRGRRAVGAAWVKHVALRWGSLLLGLEALASYIMDVETSSKYWAPSFPKRVHEDVKRMVGAVALASRAL